MSVNEALHSCVASSLMQPRKELLCDINRVVLGASMTSRKESVEGLWCRYEKSLGTMLTPPLSAEHEMGPLLPTPVQVEGSSWRESTSDIAVAGVGWLGIGVSGSAEFNVWAHEGRPLTSLLADVSIIYKLVRRPDTEKKVCGRCFDCLSWRDRLLFLKLVENR